jgi:hypothetical protein
MAKKLTLDDLKVQSFVTTLRKEESDELLGGTRLNSECCTQFGAGCDTDTCDTDTQCPNYTNYGLTYPECGGCDATTIPSECGCGPTELCSSVDPC